MRWSTWPPLNRQMQAAAARGADIRSAKLRADPQWYDINYRWQAATVRSLSQRR
jgi:hypothetical protein